MVKLEGKAEAGAHGITRPIITTHCPEFRQAFLKRDVGTAIQTILARKFACLLRELFSRSLKLPKKFLALPHAIVILCKHLLYGTSS